MVYNLGIKQVINPMRFNSFKNYLITMVIDLGYSTTTIMYTILFYFTLSKEKKGNKVINRENQTKRLCKEHF